MAESSFSFIVMLVSGEFLSEQVIKRVRLIIKSDRFKRLSSWELVVKTEVFLSKSIHYFSFWGNKFGIYFFMHRIPRQIESALREEFQRRGADSQGMGSGLKWCRFFIDFCLNKGFSPRAEESVPEFMKKLASKGQGPALCEEARQAVAVLQQILPRFEKVEDEGKREETMAKDSADLESGRQTEPRSRVPKGKAEEARVGGWKEVYELLDERFAAGHYANTTRKSYLTWVRGYEFFLGKKGVAGVSSESSAAYLTFLAKERRVTASSQNQAFNALLFLFRKVLEQPFEPKNVKRVRSRRYVPVVLSEKEVGQVFSELAGPELLIAQMLYGSGLRLTECLSLRVQSLDFEQFKVTMHRGKGAKDYPRLRRRSAVGILAPPRALKKEMRLRAVAVSGSDGGAVGGRFAGAIKALSGGV